MFTDSVSATLRDAGRRLTSARRAVVELLETRQAEHLSAEEVHRALEARGVDIHLSSVYRTLNLLADLGLVHRIDLSDAHTHFGVEREQDVHLVCTGCGSVRAARLPNGSGLNRSLRRLARKHGFEPGQVQVEVKGRCRRCASTKSGRKRSPHAAASR